MPSVGMRRSTRVFGTRVLRSGRRLSTEPHEGKNVRAALGENKWTDLLDNSAGGGGDAADRIKHMQQENENSASMDVTVEPRIEERAPEGSVEINSGDRMCGIVYRRKRKWVEWTNTDLTEDKRYGKKFVRERWRKKCGATESFGTCVKSRYSVSGCRELAIVVIESSYDCGYWVTCFLASVLSYMTRVRIGMRHLSAFVLSKPIVDAYSSRGVLFVQDFITVKNPGAKNPGICILSGSRSSVPMFSVNFSAIPSVFVHIQTSLCLRSEHLVCLVVAHSMDDNERDEKLTNMADAAAEPSCQIPSWIDHQNCLVETSQVSSGRDTSYSDVVASGNDNSGKIELSHSSGVPKSALRSLQLRNSRNIQKRRSSLRRKRGRPPTVFRTQKTSGALASDFFRIRHDGVQFSAAPGTSRLLRSSEKRSSRSNSKEPKSALGVLPQDVCASSCSANLLITEMDKCYREEGATIALELSASKRWFLVVVKDGTKRYNLTAQRVMRPSCSNRFTHATMWTGDGSWSWKLEFPNKQDWLVFKELYKQCFERNLQLAAASVIPVPGVQEVSIPVYTNYMPYVRPDSYITMKDDELTRALVRKSATYDVDSDDEEWLAKLNNELYRERELRELVSPERFELIIDALEKGFYCNNPDEHLDEQGAYEFCKHLDRREIIEAIRNYWLKKRKQKRPPLVRIFQLYQPTRRIQVIPKSVLRKKRSFKRQASQGGRGKQRPILQAIAAERDVLEQLNNAQKLQEAKASTGRFEGLAILKRQRAQMLMTNADLATYKAVLALRIAETAQLAEASESVASFFLG